MFVVDLLFLYFMVCFCYTVLVVKLQSCLKFLEELVNTQRSALRRKLILRGSEPLLCKHEDMSWSP